MQRARLGPGGETWPVDDHHGPAIDASTPPRGRGQHGRRPTGQYGSANDDVHHAVVAVVERLDPPRCPVDELVGHDQRAGSGSRAQRTDRAWREHLPDAQRPQRPQVGAVGDPVRREAVVASVSRQEGDAPAPDRRRRPAGPSAAPYGVRSPRLARRRAARRARSRR